MTASSIKHAHFFRGARFRLLWNPDVFFPETFYSQRQLPNGCHRWAHIGNWLLNFPDAFETFWSISRSSMVSHIQTECVSVFFAPMFVSRAIEESDDWWSINGLLLSCHCQRYVYPSIEWWLVFENRFRLAYARAISSMAPKLRMRACINQMKSARRVNFLLPFQPKPTM